MSFNAGYTPYDYTVGWICALPLELAAAHLMLDKEHPGQVPQPPNDQNNYILGDIEGHNIVLACLPSGSYATIQAAMVSQQMLSTFPNLRFLLMVGIGGGVPTRSDIRLGDIVVSHPTGQYGGVIQYDLGKTTSLGKFDPTIVDGRPAQLLLTAISRLRSNHIGRKKSLCHSILSSQVVKDKFAGDWTWPDQDHDRLFRSDYRHPSTVANCDECDKSCLMPRAKRKDGLPFVHYGLIASGNQVIKDSQTRDLMAEKYDVKCFEMEAAGLMCAFPFLVIRGICDYADSHKSKDWQQYAAVAASAYAKELLTLITVGDVNTVNPPREFPGNVSLRREIVEWIGASVDLDVRDDYESYLKRRHVETCEWLLNDERFQRWRDDISHSNNALWYKAPLGSGKTILSSAVIQHLKCLQYKSAYFFYSFSNPSRRNVLDGIRSLSFQLLTQTDKGVPDKLINLYKKEVLRFNRTTMRDGLAEQVLCMLLEQYSLIHIIVDGLDECINEKVMTERLSSVVNTSTKLYGKIRWFFSSREDGQIGNMMTDLDAITISPSPSIISADIRTFLTTGLQNFNRPICLSDDIHHLHCDEIDDCVTLCDGNFLYSNFVMDTLKGHGITCDSDIQRTLQEFPRTLNAYYIRSLQKLYDKSILEQTLVR